MIFNSRDDVRELFKIFVMVGKGNVYFLSFVCLITSGFLEQILCYFELLPVEEILIGSITYRGIWAASCLYAFWYYNKKIEKYTESLK